MSQLPGGFTQRPPRPEDLNFLFSTWMRACKRNIAEWARPDVGAALYHSAIELRLAREQITVVCVENQPLVIAGVAVISPQNKALLFSYVKDPFRRAGIATAMLAAVGFDNTWTVGTTTATWQGEWLARHKIKFLNWELIR